MDIKDYIKEQMEAGVNVDDILDDIYSICNEIAEEHATQTQKELDAQAIAELELDFVKKYYPNVYDKYYEDATFKELADEFIDSFDSLELYDKGHYSSKKFLDDLFDSLT